jgi:hypothetical protein
VYRREILDLIFFYKCFKGICKLYILQYVSFRIYTRNLRGIDNLTLSVPFSRTELLKIVILLEYVDCGMGYPCMYVSQIHLLYFVESFICYMMVNIIMNVIT